MPSHELTNVTRMSETDAALMRAHVHLRGGIQGVQEQISVAGIAALYDAILQGMRDYIDKHEPCASFVEGIDPLDASALYHALVRAGVFDDPLRFNRFSLILERALWLGPSSVASDFTLAEVETMLEKLGVLPFRESSLPGESPLTTL